VFTNMLRKAELDMAGSVNTSDINIFLAVGGPLEKSSIFFLLQTSFLVLDHVYVCYMTSHVKFR
jgi:hypothetical protein